METLDKYRERVCSIRRNHRGKYFSRNKILHGIGPLMDDEDAIGISVQDDPLGAQQHFAIIRWKVQTR